MLMHGLRSVEVMALNRDDVLLSEGQLRVRGKGNKLRLLPLAPETTQLLDHYLRVERPDPCSAALFVVVERARSWSTHNTRGTTFPVPPSSPHYRCPVGKSPPLQTHVRLRYGARRHQPTRIDAADGPR